MKLSKRQLKRIIREEYRRLMSESVCLDPEDVDEEMINKGEAYAPLEIAEEWLEEIAYPRKNYYIDTREIRMTHKESGEQYDVVKIETIR